jgi:hypothetical protein
MGKTVLKAFALVLALVFWLASGPVQAAATPAGERMMATVVEFSVWGELSEQAGAIIADLMMSAIANTGRFILKDRLSLSAAARIAKTQELGSTGLLDPKTAAELGRLYGVDAVVTLPVELEKVATAAPPPLAPATPPPSAPARPGEWRIGAVRADGSLDGPDRSEFARIFGGYVGRTVTRDTLLDGALRFYQSTGITLSFVVQTSASGTAELSAQVARRVRRTYESNIPIMTRSQLQNSGFGVSVQ